MAGVQESSSSITQAHSESQDSEGPVQVFLKDGTEVKANDHVYVSPSWSIRDGTPYSIARIMEFLGPEGSPPNSSSFTRVRLAWYYRPRDVLDRPPLNDSRLLLASIYSEVLPLNHVRAKCHVVHRDRISDLSGWKKRGDRFYFSRLFDPYIKKEFEVLRVGDVRNVPEIVRNTLQERYEYIAAEKEVVPDLTDTIHICATPSLRPDSVQCDRCKCYFHMRCVQPPLQAKPSRGYGWTCAPCSRRHEEEVVEMRGGASGPTNSNYNVGTGTGGPGPGSTNGPIPASQNGITDVNGAGGSKPISTTLTFPPSFKSNAPAPRGRGRPRKDKTQAEKEESLPVRQYTLVEDTLDPEDLIYPRAATRVGPKYQTLLPEEGSGHWGVDEERGSDKTVEVLAAVNDFTPSEMAESKYSSLHTCFYMRLLPCHFHLPSLSLRALYAVQTCLLNLIKASSSPDSSSNANPNDLTSQVDPRYSVDFLTEAIRQFSDATLNGRSLSSVTVKTMMGMSGTAGGFKGEKWKPHPSATRRTGAGPGYTDKPWTREEIVAFEDAIAQHGAELRAVRDEVVVRSIYEVVRFYGRWKSSKLGEENAIIRQQKQNQRPGSKPPRPARKPKSLESMTTRILNRPSSSHPLRLPSAVHVEPRTPKGNIWWKAPKGLASGVLCDNCGVGYRKYADLNMRERREESVGVTGVVASNGTTASTTGTSNSRTRGREGTGEKREGTPLVGNVSKRSKTASSSVPSTPPPVPPTSNLPQIRCCACSRNGPVGKVVKCSKCGFSVHAASYGTTGIVPGAPKSIPSRYDEWRCDLCENEETQEASVYHDCLLCPRSPSRGPAHTGPPPTSYLRACKVTESQGWAHVLCSTFIPEINFTDTTTLRCVEGISGIPSKRWISRCTICQQAGGAVVKCSDCPKEYHVSCAWAQGHTFGFEIQPVKGTRRDNHITTIFKGEPGCMNAIISCKEHDHSRRQIYEICETDEGGESALQVYCRAYKQVPQVSQTHALLRKARRLDQLIVNAVTAVNSTRARSSLSLGPGPDPTFGPDSGPENLQLSCVECTTQFTPRFYSTARGWVCHACNFTPPAVPPSAPMPTMDMDISDDSDVELAMQQAPTLLHEVAVN
ncbi:BAH-domain-containing protein [Gymnopus androsaceus JB14]|uniref:BAH-domain-containing protein n=1 Tax=Gymnopus androsaceus JB14 TaxID=1447944 RepID=A0A6A4HG92_9AGAR|nr:BAH-domain-containing protein [Gymnopus androsaceus JB14]